MERLRLVGWIMIRTNRSVVVIAILLFIPFCYIIFYSNPHRNGIERFLFAGDTAFEEPDTVRLTAEESVPKIIHFIWLSGLHSHKDDDGKGGRSHFWFNNFLSILSAYRLMTPDIIMLHCDSTPLDNGRQYFQSYKDINDHVPVIVPMVYEEWQDSEHNVEFYRSAILRVLYEHGGIFIDIDTVLIQKLRFDWTDVDLFLDSEYRIGASRRGASNAHALSLSTNITFLKTPDDFVIELNRFENANILASRIRVGDLVTSNSTIDSFENYVGINYGELHPVSIMFRDTTFGELMRAIFTGRRDIREHAKPSHEYLVPNIAHFVSFKRAEVTFMGMISMIGALNVQKVEHVFVHGDVHPAGRYWDELQARFPGQVHYMAKEMKWRVFGHWLDDVRHSADVARLEILQRNGGIYLDMADCLITHPFDHLRKFESVMAPDSAASYFSVSNGLILSKPGSTFLKHYWDSYKNYRYFLWNYNSCTIPFRIQERYPDVLHIAPNLQSIMYSFKFEGLFSNSDKDDWRSFHALHYLYPEPEEMLNPEDLNIEYMKRCITSFCQIVNHIYFYHK